MEEDQNGRQPKWKTSKMEDERGPNQSLEAIHFPGVFVYSCELCDKTFSGRNAFGVHKTQVHSKKKFTF